LINQDILESIKKNLPAIAGEMVLDELKELKRLREIETSLVKEVEKSYKLGEQLKLHGPLEEKRARLEVRELAVEERERNQEITLLKHALSESNKRADVVTDLVKTIFRNPITTRTMTGQAAGGVIPGMHGNQGFAASVPVSSTETIEEK
jgi:hypothetical protein